MSRSPAAGLPMSDFADSESPSGDGATCRVALFEGPGEPLRLARLPIPELEESEALIRVECCTICGSDLHTVSGARREATPSILGHEVLGRVARLGGNPPCGLDGTPLSVGDRVTWSTVVACGGCDRCTSGLPQKCRSLSKYGHERAEGRGALSGGLAEFVLLRRGSSVIRVPDSVPDEVACPVNCATATVAASIRAAGEVAGRRVLLFGAGMLGLTAAAMARSMGAGSVTICDLSVDRLARAGRFGAGHAVRWHADREALRQALREETGGDSFDRVIELSGAADAVEAACEFGGIGSRVVLVGTVMKSRPVAIDPEGIVRKCQSIHGMHNYAAGDLRAAVQFLERSHDQYPFGDLVARSFRLGDVNRAIAFAMETRPVRVSICP